MENATINYMAELYKKTNEDYTNFFKSVEDSSELDTEIVASKNKMKKLREALVEEENKYNNMLGKKYSEKYDENIAPPILAYTDRKGTTYYFDSITGKQSTDEAEKTINLKYKNGTIDIPSGICYSLASIIMKRINYSISSNNKEIKLVEESEYIIRILNKDNYALADEYAKRYGYYNVDIYTNYSIHTYWRLTDWKTSDIISNINVEQFFNKMFGVNRKYGLNMTQMIQSYLTNPCFETIIKTAPQEIMDDLLKRTDIDKPKSISSILGITPNFYNRAIENGIIREISYLSNYIKNTELFNINEDKWMELIKECKTHEEALDFYNILYKTDGYYTGKHFNSLIDSLASYYSNTDYRIYKYYSFGKFIDYVVNETVNQGYKNIRSFVEELNDYLKMCEGIDVKPNAYTCYLKIVHDVVSRNHSIKVSKEQDEIFVNRYKEFKPFKFKDYSIIAPKSSKDLITEGDNLSHCCGSYINRVVNGDCIIYFLRKTDDIDTSIVTIEVRGDEIKQTKAMNNRKPEKEHVEVITEFAKKRNLKYNPAAY